jgi:hypothetical protein
LSGRDPAVAERRYKGGGTAVAGDLPGGVASGDATRVVFYVIWWLPFGMGWVKMSFLIMKNKLVELPDRKYGANHHIWDNNGTWWCHLSLERRSGPAKRIRFSLRTNNVREARKRRDLIMNANEAKAKALIKSWK